MLAEKTESVDVARLTLFERSLRTWRARLSVPALLGSCDERRVVAVVAAVNGASCILSISVVAWLFDLPLLFPALGPTAFILFSTPFSPDAAPRSVIVGHLLGIASGCVVWLAVGSIAHSVSIQESSLTAIVSASVALGLIALLLVRFGVKHPPACASALVIALGGITEWTDLAGMVLAVVLLVVLAVAVNRLCCLQVPIWRSRDLEV